MIRFLPFALVSSLAALSSMAQQVTAVDPGYAVVGKETQIVVQGTQFPWRVPESAGLKISTQPPNACIHAHRYKPVSPTRYYLACTFPSNTANKITLKILNKPVKKREKPIELWQGPIQLLAGEPSVTEIRVLSQEAAGYDRMLCTASGFCLRISGLPYVGVPFEISVHGANLPHTLSVDGLACQDLLRVNDWSTDKRIFACQSTAPGDLTFRVLSAPASRNGNPLHEGQLHVASRQ